eukprot:SAG31_NODE_457_length_15415_cov_4.380387_10_plen_90_part_00
MDPEWIDAALLSIEANLDRLFFRGIGDGLDGDSTLAKNGSRVLEGSGRADLIGLLRLPPPHNEPFLRMLGLCVLCFARRRVPSTCCLFM